MGGIILLVTCNAKLIAANKHFWVWFISSLLLLFSAATQASVAWLNTQAQPDGSFITPTPLATPYQATSEVLRTFVLMGESNQPTVPVALQFINSESFHNTENLSRKIIVNNRLQQDTSALLAELRAMQNVDGGYGELHSYDSTSLDTAYALQAFAELGDTSSSSVQEAVVFLLLSQAGDGGWHVGNNESSVFVTANVVQALTSYKSRYVGVAQALNAAVTFLLSKKADAVSWVEEFESASALIALTNIVADTSTIEGSIDALRSRRLTNTSWSDDVFTTALAMQALALFDARSNNTATTSKTATINAQVVRAGSSEAISRASISIAGNLGLSATSNSAGQFTLSNIPAGDHTLIVQKSGFIPNSSIVTLVPGQTLDLGQIILNQDIQFGMLSGLIVNSEDGAGLQGVLIELNGAVTTSILTDALGHFEINQLPGGTYSGIISKQGFNSATGQLQITVGAATQLNHALTIEGAFQDSNPVTLSGRVISDASGLPIAGVLVEFSNGQTATTEVNGQFAIPDVARGNYTASLSASGFVTKQLQLLVPAGAQGDLGDFTLYTQQVTQAPTTLTLLGKVISGLNNDPINNASVEMLTTTQVLTTDTSGAFTLSGITEQEFQLRISAAGFTTQTFPVSATGFGEANATFVLPLAVIPDPTIPDIIESTLSGTVTDQNTGLPIANATLAILGSTQSVQTDIDGQYLLAGITALEFDLSISAANYEEIVRHIKLGAHALYTYEPTLLLKPIVVGNPDTFQITSVSALDDQVAANTTALIQATISNLTTSLQTAQIVGEVLTTDGERIATLTPYAVGTTVPQSEFDVTPSTSLTVTLPWAVAQAIPDTYTVIIRVVQLGTIGRDLPTGTVLAQGQTYVTTVSTSAISGAMAIDPPLVQAGTTSPVTLDVLIANEGNVPLIDQGFELTITDPQTSNVLLIRQATLSQLNINQHRILSFGDYIPVVFGNLSVSVRPIGSAISGQITDTMYVGDKATGTFTVDKTFVPEGTQTVRGTITLSGVDARTGSGTDPLYIAVRNAVQSGGEYVAPNAVNWHKTNRCLGCHIQTQSVLGLASSKDKAPIDEFATNTLFNSIASSQQPDGGLRISHPQHTKVQTALGIWSLAAWQNKEESFVTMLEAAKHLYDRRSQSGSSTSIDTDHNGGWWGPTSDAVTAVSAVGFADVIQSSETINLASVFDYALGTQFNLPVGTLELRDVEVASNGLIYISTFAGDIVEFNPLTGTAVTLASGFPQTTGLAVDADDSFYVAQSNGTIQHVQSDGTATVLATGLGTLIDIELGPDDNLYVAVRNTNQILQVSKLGVVNVMASGGLILDPFGLAFDSNGDLLVTNRAAYNIARISTSDASNTVSMFLDNLAYPPLYITLDPEGGFYVTHQEHAGWMQTTQRGIFRVSANGLATRVADSNGVRGIAVTTDGRIFTADDATSPRTLREVTKQPVNTSLVPTLRTQIDFIANNLIARGLTSTENQLLAFRLIGIAEARSVTTDPTRKLTLDTAINTLATTLRARQNADGGWGRFTGNSSDPMMSALVGIALDFTNPSADDPLVRNTIQYLLNSQSADKSWPIINARFSTRLASTSFVMAYMPKALDRLGGIDVDLNVSIPDNIQLANPIVPATSQVPTAGGIDYSWSLQGVTSNSQIIEFDLTLDNMVLDEIRASANSVFMTFQNSFNADIVRVDLDIPTVTAKSEMVLGVSTNRAVYGANETVNITSVVDNLAPVDGTGTIQLSIRPAGSVDAIATIPVIDIGVIPTAGQLAFGATFDTGTHLAGGYEVIAQLVDASARVLSEATVAFSILHQGSAVNSSVTTDKSIYAAWDNVQLTGRIRNISVNVIQPATFVEIKVLDPQGTTIFFDTANTNQLMPTAIVDRPFSLTLADAVAGIYSVEFIVKDDFSREVVATAQTNFVVERTSDQAITGRVTVEPRIVTQGDTAVCTEDIRNLSATDLNGIQLSRKLISLDTSVIIEETNQQIDLPGNAMVTNIRNVDSSTLEPGGYVCLLDAVIDAQTSRIGVAGFDVVEPPIKLAVNGELSGKGRLLVWLAPSCQSTSSEHNDDSDHDSDHDDDSEHDADHDSDHSSCTMDDVLLAQQQTYLADLFTRAGWQATIVTTKTDFTQQFRSGGYVAYALLGHEAELEDELDDEIQEAVFRGEGLLIATGDDDPDDALGIDDDTSGSATGLSLLASPLHVGGLVNFSQRIDVKTVELEGAASLASFTSLSVSHHRYTPPNNALTTYDYGSGQSVYVGFNLLAQARLQTTGNDFETILLNSLSEIHPDDALPTYEGSVVPVTITVVNQGIATPGRVIMALPANVQAVITPGAQVINNTIIWPFDIAEDAVLSFQAWVRITSDASDVTLPISIQSGTDPDFIEQANGQLLISVNLLDAVTALTDIINQVYDLRYQDSHYYQAYYYLIAAQTALNSGDIATAHYKLLLAAEEVGKINTDTARQIRLDIDYLIRDLALQL